MATLEGWDTLFKDCIVDLRPNRVCFNIRTYEDFLKNDSQVIGCGSNYGYAYFLSFIVVFSFVLLSLMVGIIMEMYNLRASISHSKVSAESLNEF
jgi:hypothetical protein